MSSGRRPDPWGLRGDPFAWQALEAEVTARGLPSSPEEAAGWLSEGFETVVGADLAVDREPEAVLVDRFAHGGMSSGYVHLQSWRDRFIPTLNSRVEELIVTDGARLADRYRLFEGLAVPFTKSIAAKRVLLDDEAPTSAAQRRRVAESIADDLRKLTDIVAGPVLEVDVSEAARNEAGLDLTAETWHTQPSFDPGRTKFMFEHVTPISSLRAGCLHAPNTEGMVGFLWRNIRCAWILKTENKALNRLSYSTLRVRPLAAYSEAGIQLA